MGIESLKYEKYWNLSRLPFKSIPDTDMFFPSATHTEAKVRILHAIRTGKNAALVTGKIGSGKTILWRSLKKDLEISEPLISVSVITNPNLELIDFLKEMAKQIGVQISSENKREILNAIEEKLIQECREGKTPIIIIDECQVIKDREIWNELRLMLNWLYNDTPILTPILIGQPEVADIISSIRELAQRIPIHYHLQSFNLDDTKRYIDFILEKSGSKTPIFSEDALSAIFGYSAGIPREINHICDHCLLLGAIKGVQAINSAVVEDVMKDIRKQERQFETEGTIYLHKETAEINRSDYEATTIYEDILRDLRTIFASESKIADPELILRPHIPVLIENVLSSETLCRNVLHTHEDMKDLAIHCLNVAILSMYIGKSIGYSRDNLRKLALPALMHDIGMKEIPLKILEREGRLLPHEMEIIKKHPEYSFEWCSNNINSEVASIVLHIHERMDGSGYIHGLESTEIHEFSYIIGAADIFNALVHKRPYRDRLSSFEAVIKILECNKKGFPQNILKAVIINFILPEGSYVELNSGEIGSIISTNKENPLRPVVVVEITPDKTGTRLDQPKIIDLSREPLLFVKRNFFEVEKPE